MRCRILSEPEDSRSRSEQEPPGEAALEVAGDPEAGEDAAEGGRLKQHEGDLEGGSRRG